MSALYIELEADKDVDQFINELEDQLTAEAHTAGYWSGLESQAYARAGRPLPTDSRIHWNPRNGFVSLPAYRPGVAVHRVASGGAVIELDPPARGPKSRIKSWLEARPGSKARDQVSGRFLKKLREVEAERQTREPSNRGTFDRRTKDKQEADFRQPGGVDGLEQDARTRGADRGRG